MALHNQGGRLEAGQAEPGWWSTQWERVSVGSAQPQVAQQPEARQPVQREQPSKTSQQFPVDEVTIQVHSVLNTMDEFLKPLFDIQIKYKYHLI